MRNFKDFVYFERNLQRITNISGLDIERKKLFGSCGAQIQDNAIQHMEWSYNTPDNEDETEVQKIYLQQTRLYWKFYCNL
jgi:hypothetical protein